MFLFLKWTGIRLLDFKNYVVATREAVRDRSLAQAERDPVCLNGREWLARQLTRRGCDCKRLDNCFPWIENVDLAQRLPAVASG